MGWVSLLIQQLSFGCNKRWIVVVFGGGGAGVWPSLNWNVFLVVLKGVVYLLFCCFCCCSAGNILFATTCHWRCLHLPVPDVQDGAQQEHSGERPSQQLGQHQHGPGAQCHHLPRMLQGVTATPHHQARWTRWGGYHILSTGEWSVQVSEVST